MHIVAIKFNKDGLPEFTSWVDRLIVTKEGHIKAKVNGSFSFETTRVVRAQLVKPIGIIVHTRSGAKYIISTPSRKAMRKLFKQFIV